MSLFKTLKPIAADYRIQIIPTFNGDNNVSLNIILAPVKEGGLIPPVIRVTGTIEEVDSSWPKIVADAVGSVEGATTAIEDFNKELTSRVEAAKKAADPKAAKAKDPEPKAEEKKSEPKKKAEAEKPKDSEPAPETPAPGTLKPAWKKKQEKQEAAAEPPAAPADPATATPATPEAPAACPPSMEDLFGED